MINWYEMYTLGRDAHTERISEAQQPDNPCEC